MQQKVWQRLSNILAHGSRQAILMLGNAAIALLVIRGGGEELWGGFVKVFVLVSLCSHIINWGNRDYLLRQFGLNPALTSQAFCRSLASRAVLLFCGLILVYCLVEGQQRIWSAVWMISYYLYQSLDVFIIYHRRYAISALVELVGLFAILLSCMLMPLNVDFLVAVFGLSFLLRAILLVWCLPSSIWDAIGTRPSQPIVFLNGAKWFFLIGFSGLLQSRIDLYAISLFLSDEEVGRYQIMISLLILIQTCAGIIMTPFAINLMRQPFGKMIGISRKLLTIGLPISILGVGATFLILRMLYGIDLPLIYYWWSFPLVLPIFSYLTWIYYLYGLKLEKWVMGWNFMGALTNLIITLILIPWYGILGALVSSALVQCLLAIAFPLTVKNLRKRLHQS